MTTTIDLSTLVRSAVPRTVNNQILLDRGASSAGAADATFRAAITGYTGLGGFRWPGFGGGSQPLFHFNQPHTYNFNGFTTAQRGNYWASDYTTANAGALSEIISLDDFTDLCALVPGVRPHLIFNWRGSISINGDPMVPPRAYQLDIDDVLIDTGVAATYTSADWMKLHNRRMLKRFVSRSGILNPVVHMGGEDWTKWSDEPDDGVGSLVLPVQWTLPDPNGTNKFNYITSKQAEFLADLKSYADSQGWTSINYCVGFTEAINGGTGPQGDGFTGDIAMAAGTVTNYNNHFIASVTANAAVGATLFGCTFHYRGDWAKFLTEEELVFSFFRPGGKGTLQQCRDHVITTAAAVNPSYVVDFYPLENGVGQPQNAYGSNDDMTEWQMGLAAAQYVMDAVKAGFNYADGYLGFTKDYTTAGSGHAAGFNPLYALTGRTSGANPALLIHPQYYARRLVGAPLQHTPDVATITTDETELPMLCYKWTRVRKERSGCSLSTSAARAGRWTSRSSAAQPALLP
jgi:hypothetical protein